MDVSPRSEAIASASSTIAAVKLEEPIARTVPSCTSSSQGAERLLERRDAVGTVVLVKVDPVGLQPAQRCLDRLRM